jgi:hypothetical protein
MPAFGAPIARTRVSPRPSSPRHRSQHKPSRRQLLFRLSRRRRQLYAPACALGGDARGPVTVHRQPPAQIVPSVLAAGSLQRLPCLQAPNEQLLRRQSMTPRHDTNRIPARQSLGYDPCLVLGAPGPSADGAREHLDPPNRLHDSIMLSVHSKSNGPNQTAEL